MLFRKLFQVLVVGGAVLGTGANSGCSTPASAQQPEKKGDGGAQASTQGTDAGTPDAGSGSGVQGW
ncbi:MAG TPA: hypothetical protein VMK66_10935 [Myxococcales bacterium]|nr:hypothetical protein [Myxococcales bacterium]